MNTLTEHDRKLSETLRSLTLEPQAKARRPGGTRTGWMIGILVAAAVPAAVMLVLPDRLKDVPTGFWSPPEPAKQEQAAALSVTVGDRQLPPFQQPPQPAVREITGSGYVVAPRFTSVFARYEGKITGLAVDVGDTVETGQPLVILADASARLRLEQAKAAKVSAELVLAARQITLEQATASFRRAEALAQRDVTSKREREEAETAWKNARNTLEQSHQEIVRAELAIRLAQDAVDELTVRAPFAATVTKLSAHIGDTVLARADSVRENQSLLTLTDTSSMVIDADIAETNVSLLSPGLRGEATLDGFPDQPFVIELQRIAPVASVEKGTIGLRLSLVHPPAGTRPNMAARIRLTIPETHTQIGEAKP